MSLWKIDKKNFNLFSLSCYILLKIIANAGSTYSAKYLPNRLHKIIGIDSKIKLLLRDVRLKTTIYDSDFEKLSSQK